MLTAPTELLADITPVELETFFIVSKVELKIGELQIEVKKSAGVKCVRCWKFFQELNSDGICPRCETAVVKSQKI
jgi:isoleucyl-tRNA synthetase